MFPPNRVLMLEELLLLVEGPTCQFIAVFDWLWESGNEWEVMFSRVTVWAGASGGFGPVVSNIREILWCCSVFSFLYSFTDAMFLCPDICKYNHHYYWCKKAKEWFIIVVKLNNSSWYQAIYNSHLLWNL